MTAEWAKWEKQVINGVFPLHRAVSFSDHSVVFLTEHEALDVPTALLKLVPAIPTLKEAQLTQWATAATLTHPHLIRLLEAGRCQLGGLQFLFVVMEYAQESLANILTQGALTPDTLRKELRPILTSLAFLHGKQLVQGGLKPSNILLVNQQLKLASDTVRPAGESTASIASSSVYDPPESRDGSFSTPGDIWSLGVIMVEALTQRQPSWPGGRSATAVLPATLPPEFAPIVRQCLNRNPHRRPTVADLEAEINAVPKSTMAPVLYPVLSPPRYPVLSPAHPSATAQLLASEEPDLLTPSRPSPKRHAFVPAGTAILVVAILVWTGLRLLGSQAYSSPTALPAATTQNPTPTVSAPPSAPPEVSTASLEGPTARPEVRTAALETPTGRSEAPATPPEVSTAPPDPGFAESQTAVAPSSVLHEEAPDVPVGALATIHGHIKFAVRVTADRSGNVVHATLANYSPSRYFTRLAIENARKWKFAAADNQESRQWMLRFEFTRDGATAHARHVVP